MKIARSHPRYKSLVTRERLEKLSKEGVVAGTGLIAHGRGEAFDYLLGERTTRFAEKAEMAAAAHLLLAENPVLSVNGNVAALAAKEIVQLARAVPAKVEVNLFHRTEARMRAVARLMEKGGARDVLGLRPDRRIPGLAHARAKATSEGIYGADVVLVPLEDGDRAQALAAMGKIVITIELNPLSRTARAADVTVVDELTRALPRMTGFVRELRGDEARCRRIAARFNNQENLAGTVKLISKRLSDEFRK